MTPMKAFYLARNHLTFLKTFFGFQGLVVYFIWAMRKGLLFAIHKKWDRLSAFCTGFESAWLKAFSNREIGR
jgi:hypothetical protein